jgi:hypothetical protein
MRSEEKLSAEHDRIATAVHEIAREHWEVETLSSHAGATVPTHQLLECLE